MVILATREGNFDFSYVRTLPFPNLVALAKQLMKAIYREQYEWAWTNFVSSQCEHKALKDLTNPWKKIAGIR